MKYTRPDYFFLTLNDVVVLLNETQLLNGSRANHLQISPYIASKPVVGVERMKAGLSESVPGFSLLAGDFIVYNLSLQLQLEYLRLHR